MAVLVKIFLKWADTQSQGLKKNYVGAISPFLTMFSKTVYWVWFKISEWNDLDNVYFKSEYLTVEDILLEDWL